MTATAVVRRRQLHTEHSSVLLLLRIPRWDNVLVHRGLSIANLPERSLVYRGSKQTIQLELCTRRGPHTCRVCGSYVYLWDDRVDLASPLLIKKASTSD